MSSFAAFLMLAAVGVMFAQFAPAAKNTRAERFAEAEFEAVWTAEQAKRGKSV